MKIKTSVLAVLLIILAGLLICTLVTGAKLSAAKQSYSDLEKKYLEDEEYISAKNSRTFTYFGESDDIVISERGLGKIRVAASADMPRHEYDLAKITEADGLKSYDDGVIQSKAGIDVSYHNGYIDWEAVKNSGIDFAMLRIGYRGYESGDINPDKNFGDYIRDAKSAGIDVGIYFFSQALTVEEAIEEADYVVSCLDGYDIPYPVVYDWEVMTDNARTDEIYPDTLNDCAAAFCNRIAENGYIPMIYASKRQALFKYDLNKLAGFDFWLAEYSDEPEFPYMFTMWQYASDGKIDGIDGDVDVNISFVDYTKERR